MAGDIKTQAAIHTSGMGPGELERAVLANAIRIFNAGATMGLRPAGRTIGAAWKAEVQRLYSQPGTGKHHKGMPFRSSSAGEPPAEQTSELKESVKYKVSRKPGRSVATGQFVKGFGQTEIVIYTTTPYAGTLELGTKGKGKQIAARPAWQPARQNMLHRKVIFRAIVSNPDGNFIEAERKAAAAMKLANPKTTFAREKAAGR